MAPDRPSAERAEWRDALLTYVPAILVAFVVNWALATYGGLAPRRALLAGIGVGIALALALQRLLHHRGSAG